MKKLIQLLFVLSALSCNLDDGNTVPIPDETIMDVASKNPDLSTLVVALQRTDLTAMLQGTTLYTAMAPTNAAFTNFLGANGYAGIDDVPIATLRKILLNHLLSGRVEAAVLTNLQKNYVQTNAEGPIAGTNLALYFDATDGITINGTIDVTQTDILASNGIIHLVDAIIELPTLKTFISYDDNFKDFDTALDIVSPLSNAPSLLSENAPLTVFIPIKQAFDNLLDTDPNWNAISDIDETLLTAIVEHHIVDGNLRSTDLSAGQTLSTLEGDNIVLYALDGNLEITDGMGNDGSIIGTTDIQAINGVIHLIPNKVLLPNTSN